MTHDLLRPPSPSPHYLRSITTVHFKPQSNELVMTEQFWRDLLPTWTFLPYQLRTEDTERLQEVISRVHRDWQQRVRSSTLLLLEDVDRPRPNECLIAIDPHTQEVSIRIFGRFLTDIQSTSEWFIARLLDAQEHFVITPHTRSVIAIVIQEERTDLTIGRVIPAHHHLWRGFYKDYFYNINITALILLLTLAVVLLVTPDDIHSALGKFYGICERVLSAALMNVFLLVGQFYVYRKNRHVIEWEKP